MPSDPTKIDECHCDTLNDCLKACATTQKLIDKMRAAGFDMDAAEEENKRQASIAAGIKREFYPDRH